LTAFAAAWALVLAAVFFSRLQMLQKELKQQKQQKIKRI
jgi:hypothetical protein